MILIIVLFITTFISMEAVAWLAHRYIMHGILWYLHEDHHLKGEERFFEKNDAFFLIFSIPGFLGFLFGTIYYNTILLSIASGITAYGLCYFLVHDIFIHQRFNLFRNSNSRYLRAVRRAHKMHHKHLGKYQGESFGMLFFPVKYWKQSLKK